MSRPSHAPARSAAGEPVLTPSKITAWLECAHYLTLRSQVDDGTRAAPASTFSAFAHLLVRKGRRA